MGVGITLTGADEKTRVSDLARLSAMGAEIGLLYTHSPDGRNRYPRRGWIRDVAETDHVRVALHICGSRARQELMQGDLDELVSIFPRVQVNGVVEVAQLELLCAAFYDRTIITQHDRLKNSQLIGVQRKNHAILCDGSGGRGLSPNEWVRPETEKTVGFAGGLGSSNLQKQLPHIAASAKGDWWVDMEGKLRSAGDRFDVGIAEECVILFNAWRQREEKLPGSSLHECPTCHDNPYWGKTLSSWKRCPECGLRGP